MFVSGPVGTSVTGRGLAAIVRAMKSTACSPSGVALRRRQRGPSSPLSPWTWAATVSSRVERPVGAGGDGHVRPADEVEHAQRVRGRLLERLVAVHGRDAEHLELRARECEQQRDRVVVAGIAVEDDRDRRAHAARQYRRRPRPRSAATAARRAATRRARRPRTRARAPPPRSRPSSSDTSRHAVNASPAAVPSTASTAAARRARPPPRPRAGPLPRHRA